MSDAGAKNFIELTANIVSAYLSNNPTPAAEIPNLISQVHGALVRVSSGRAETAPLEPAKPAVSLKKSIAPDYLVCLEDGKRFKSLKSSAHPVQHDAGAIPREMGPAGRLSHGRAQLCRGALATGEADGLGTAAAEEGEVVRVTALVGWVSAA